MSLLVVRALGSFEVAHAGQVVTGFPRRKTTALLIYLCLEHPGKMHQRDALAGLLWPDIPQEDARRNLRQCLYQLRQVLQDHSDEAQAHLQVSAQLVGLKAAELDCDVSEFRRLCAANDPAGLDTALDFYRGEILAGFGLPDAPEFDEWLFFQREETQRSLKKALQSQRGKAEETRRWPAAIEILRRLLALDPLDEDYHRALMRAFFANGERRAALDQYATCRSVLAAELGLAPQPETTALFQKLKTAPLPVSGPAELPATGPHPPASTAEQIAANLPVQLTSFIGRESDVQTTCAILRRPDVHLLTLTGPGGIGKTRLGLEVAAQLEKDFAQGVFFVPLASTTDPELVGTAIANVLGVKEISGQNIEQTLQQALRHRRALLLLDNFEQIVEAAGLVENLLKAAPGLKILVTSRFVLKVYGENEYAVRPLGLPDNFRLPGPDDLATYPAVRLFCERAQASRPDFRLTAENAAAVVEVCSRLDGLPLALELVAARIKLFAPQALVSRLRNRLALATGGARTLPQRQQTLRGAIGWSYDLLEPLEKELFAGLAVFAGGCSLPAVLEVCADLAGEETLIETLLGLVDKSLVRNLTAPNGEPRFGMLETIREFAGECLENGEQAAGIHQAHARYYTEMAEKAEPYLHGKDQIEWADSLEYDHDNFRAALQFCLDRQQIELAGRLAGALGWFWYLHSHLSEGRRWLDRVLEVAGEVAPRLRARLLGAAGYAARLLGDYERASVFVQGSVALYRELGDKTELAENLRGLGMIAVNTSQYEAGIGYMEEGLQLFEQLNNKWGLALSFISLAKIYLEQGDFKKSEEFYERGIEIGRQSDKATQTYGEIGLVWVYLARGEYARAERQAALTLNEAKTLNDQNLIAWCVWNQSEATLGQGQLEKALKLAEESYFIWNSIDDDMGRALAFLRLSAARLSLDQLDLAVADFRAGLKLWHAQRGFLNCAVCLEGLARIAARQQRFDHATRWLSVANCLRERYRTPLTPLQKAVLEPLLTTLRDNPAFESEWSAGANFTLEEAIAEAFAEF